MTQTVHSDLSGGAIEKEIFFFSDGPVTWDRSVGCRSHLSSRVGLGRLKNGTKEK